MATTRNIEFDLVGNNNLDLSYLGKKSVAFGKVDTDSDGYVDSLKIYNGTIGTILIRDYFNDTSPNVITSGSGTGTLNLIDMKDADLRFSDIQSIFAAKYVSPSSLTTEHCNNIVYNTTSSYLGLSDYSHYDAVFQGKDTDNDGNVDALKINLKDGNSILVSNYFNDSNPSIDTSQQGSGYLNTIHFKDADFHFADIHSPEYIAAMEYQEALDKINLIVKPNQGPDDIVYHDQSLSPETMRGGLYNTSYYVNNPLDVVKPVTGATGIDTVYSTVDYKLPANAEILHLLGHDDLVGYGNSQTSILLGNSGHDTLIGGSGNNNFFISYMGNSEYEQYYGGEEGGSQVMIGGLKSNNYLVDSVDDVVISNPLHAGTDTVYVSLDYYVVPENVDKLYLVTFGNYKVDASAHIDNLILNGNCGSNEILGGSGDDRIYGGGYGNDTLVGGDGNDVIQASVRAGKLYGGNGNDTINSNFGNDILCGGAGDDTYKGFTKNIVLNEHGDYEGPNGKYFMGFGNDIIRDYADYDGTVTDARLYHDMLDLTKFYKSELTYSARDMDGNGHVDALQIDAGQYGSILIDKYFDDSSSSAQASHSDIGSVYCIHTGSGQYLHFDDIQALLPA